LEEVGLFFEDTSAIDGKTAEEGTVTTENGKGKVLVSVEIAKVEEPGSKK
jgi:predicted aconitase